MQCSGSLNGSIGSDQFLKSRLVAKTTGCDGSPSRETVLAFHRANQRFSNQAIVAQWLYLDSPLAPL